MRDYYRCVSDLEDTFHCTITANYRIYPPPACVVAYPGPLARNSCATGCDQLFSVLTLMQPVSFDGAMHPMSSADIIDNAEEAIDMDDAEIDRVDPVDQLDDTHVITDDQLNEMKRAWMLENKNYVFASHKNVNGSYLPLVLLIQIVFMCFSMSYVMYVILFKRIPAYYAKKHAEKAAATAGAAAEPVTVSTAKGDEAKDGTFRIVMEGLMEESERKAEVKA